jgi:hypothetical protein
MKYTFMLMTVMAAMAAGAYLYRATLSPHDQEPGERVRLEVAEANTVPLLLPSTVFAAVARRLFDGHHAGDRFCSRP